MVRIELRHVERNAFKAEMRYVEGHGDYWLAHQQTKPHVVPHVKLPKTEAEFDNIHTPVKIKCRLCGVIYHNGAGATIEEEVITDGSDTQGGDDQSSDQEG